MTTSGHIPRSVPGGPSRRIALAAIALACLALSPPLAVALDHSGSITTDETWFAADNPHVVVSTVTVQTDVTLTIEDGAEVRFPASQRINVYGTLNAPGTAGQGIDFVPDTDDWYGLRFFTNGGGSFSYCELVEAYIGFDMNGSSLLALDHCDISGGAFGVDASAGTLELSSVSVSGAGTAGIRCIGVAPDFLDNGTVIENCAIGLEQRDVPGVVLDTPLVIRGATDAGLRLDNCPGALVDNVSFESCTGIEGAILAEDAGDFTLGAGNVIGGGATACSWPLTVNTASFPSPASVIPASGNTNNAIQVRTGSGNRSGTWPAFAGLDYVVTATPTVAAGGSLTIADGVTVRFVASQRINVYGTLNAPGTAGQGVDFVPDTDDWYGLRFFTNGTGSFSHCLVDGAYVGFDFNADNQLELVGVTIQNGEFGIQADGGTTSLVNCRVIANASYGIDIGDGAVEFGGDETEWNDIYGNGDGNAGRQLRNGPVDLLAANVYWGTLDYQEIKDGITDEEDDVDLGLVSVAPYLDEDHMTVAVGVEDPGTTGEALPAVTTVFQNHPNPFNPATAIRFDLRADAVVSLEVFDLSGRRVATLVDGAVDAGRHRIDWRGTDDHGRGLASGIYLYRFEAGGVSEVKRMTLVR